MSDSIEKVLLNVIEKQLSAVLVGVCICLLYIFRVWDVPTKWDKINNQIREISKRQRRIYQVLKILASQYDEISNDKISTFLEVSNDEEDSEIS
jgi:hypothetical protein